MQFDLMRETVIRWSNPFPRHVPVLQEGGITAVVSAPSPAFEKACADAGIKVIPQGQVRLLAVGDAVKAQPGEMGWITTGLWPGTRNPQANVASATTRLWMDQNCYLVGYLRALHPGQPAVLAYLPDAAAGIQPGRVVRFDSFELALVEAWVAGGNYVLGLDTRFRDALLTGVRDAGTAWRNLGRTAAWLRMNSALFRQPALPVITVLVDEGAASLEIANLCYRFNVSPALVPATDPPAPDPRRRLVVAAASIAAPSAAIRTRILAHATAGATVVADEPGEKAWWRVPGMTLLKNYADREVFSTGKGQIVAYKEPISEPGEFAQDLIDIASQQRRPARIWNSQGSLALATLAPSAGPLTGMAALHVINYGQPTNETVLVRIQGNFARATLVRPEGETVTLRVAPRGTASEVELPQLGRVASIVFN